ncbi:MAG: hypothetical protein A3J29_06150 [Acidobacteria bacterium RIFCSPLOWO2_12_FULL_67_14b]|nr:MAG: hypothetical protein A3J29_06150 [Acidobacteria bacterium RIFCSPLOWO2_12_FULL_67_14b]
MAGRPNNAAAIAGHVQGLRELKAAFQKLPEIVREHLNDATETSVREGARLAQANLSRSPSIDTRALYDHVGWAMNRKAGRGSFGIKRATTVFTVGGKKVRVKGLIRAGAGGSASTGAGATKDQPSRRAHFVEFGPSTMPAEPFVIPAAEAIRADYLDRCVRAGKGIERDMATVGAGRL